MVFWGFVFWGFNIKKVCFWCVWHCFKSVKNACFSQFLGFSGVAYYCSSGFRRFRCFCVSCVCLSLLCCSRFCFVCFVIGFVVVLFFVLFFFFVFFVFVLFFCFFGFLERWPKGPPHLTLNPPYFLVFVFCCFFVFFFLVFLFLVSVFLEGLRVRWGGPKGHLTWP